MSENSILIVEDEAIVALDLQLQLEGLGYTVVGGVGSGQEAVSLAALLKPDVVLMDIRLQGKMDGIEAAQTIRTARDVPIIFLTSHSDDETVRRAAHTAPYGYLTKPFQIRELRAGIEVALAKSRMERQLREADLWFAQTLQCVADGVIVTDLEAKILFLNPAAEGMTGWSIEEAVGRTVDEIVHIQAPDRGGRAAHAAAQLNECETRPGALVLDVLARGRVLPAVHALDLRCRDGSSRVVDESAGPVNDEGGARLGAVLVLRDASHRVIQEGLLKASEERFRTAFDHAPLGMALVSLAGEFIQVNAALCRLLRATSVPASLHGTRALASDADREHEMLRLNRLLTGAEDVVQFERRFLRLDGSDPVCTLVSVSLLREGEQPTCYLFQVHDLTEQKRAAEHLAELAEERVKREASEIAHAAKSDFLSRASHEMRTPLNAVIGFAQLLEMLKGSDPAKTETYAHHIRVAGEHLMTLVTDLLDLNRVSHGTLKLSPQPLKLVDTVHEATDMLRGFAQDHGVDLSVHVAPELMVLADATRLRQVLINLGSNAVKYNRQGGLVRISADVAAPGCVRVVVEDTGIGMTTEQLSRLFNPFERLGLERTRIPGVGLGLAIARSLVIEMGGALSVSSRPCIGTIISVDLPLGA